MFSQVIEEAGLVCSLQDSPIFVVDLVTISRRINDVQAEPNTVFADHCTASSVSRVCNGA